MLELISYFVIIFLIKIEDKTLKNKDKNKTKKVPASSTQAHNISLKEVLSQSRSYFWSHLTLNQDKSLEQHIEEIEEALYMADIGPKTVALFVEKAQRFFKTERLNKDSLRSFLQREMDFILKSSLDSKHINESFQTNPPLKSKPFKAPHQKVLNSENSSQEARRPILLNSSVYAQLSHGFNHSQENSENSPENQKNPRKKSLFVLLIVGVNGAGKTTTIGKLSQNLVTENKKVLIAAGDTFRAAAEEQLKVWTERARAEIFSPEGVKDPSAVAFDAVSKAAAKNFDVCIIDTAGRLHTQDSLMGELEKVKRVIQKVIPEAPHHTWIILDASSGQNALYQAQSFNERLNLTGAILTKMDGSSKGGIALAIAQELQIPIRYIGVGENISDLRPFERKEFVESLI